MKIWQGCGILIWVCGLLLNVAWPVVAQENVDTVYYNGTIYTVDAVNRVAEAVAIRGDQFVKVGANEAVLALAKPATRRVDLKGHTVIPGLIDSHIHPIRLALDLAKVDLWDAQSIANVVSLIGKRAKTTPKGEWVQASSLWHESQLKENRFPTRWELDAAAPEHPVFIPRGGHNVVVNSYALRLAGITKDTPDPPGGHIIRDKETGEPTGYLLERPAFAAIMRMLPQPKPQETTVALKEAMGLLNAAGVTGVRDAFAVPSDIQAYTDLRDRGLLTVRISYLVGISPKTPIQADLAELEKLKTMLPKDDTWLHFDGLKIIGDGGIEAAMLREPYKGRPNFTGIPVTSKDKMQQIIEWAQANGWQVNIHCVGGRCMDIVLALYEAAHAKKSVMGLGWSIEHGYMPSKQNFRQIHRLGLKVTLQPIHLYTLGVGWLDYWGRPRTDYTVPTRAYLDHGIAVGSGTDAPVCPYNPFLAMWVEVTRKTRAAGVMGPTQSISIAQALRLHTINSAAITGEDHIKGSIEAGKLADFVVLSNDLLGIPTEKIKEVEVLLTVVGGKEVFKR